MLENGVRVDHAFVRVVVKRHRAFVRKQKRAARTARVAPAPAGAVGGDHGNGASADTSPELVVAFPRGAADIHQQRPIVFDNAAAGAGSRKGAQVDDVLRFGDTPPTSDDEEGPVG